MRYTCRFDRSCPMPTRTKHCAASFSKKGSFIQRTSSSRESRALFTSSSVAALSSSSSSSPAPSASEELTFPSEYRPSSLSSYRSSSSRAARMSSLIDFRDALRRPPRALRTMPSSSS